MKLPQTRPVPSSPSNSADEKLLFVQAVGSLETKCVIVSTFTSRINQRSNLLNYLQIGITE